MVVAQQGRGAHHFVFPCVVSKQQAETASASSGAAIAYSNSENLNRYLWVKGADSDTACATSTIESFF